MKDLGFTIIELIVIITVIAIIGGGSYSLYQGRREQALASIIWTDLNTIEGALTTLAKSEGINEWWAQSDFGSTGAADNPTLEEIAQVSELERYLAQPPEPADPNLSRYLYDNDAEFIDVDTYNPTNCSNPSHVSRGVNIRIRSLNGNDLIKRSLAKLDEIYDNGNPNCGKVTYSTSGNNITLYYHIARGQMDYPSTID